MSAMSCLQVCTMAVSRLSSTSVVRRSRRQVLRFLFRFLASTEPQQQVISSEFLIQNRRLERLLSSETVSTVSSRCAHKRPLHLTRSDVVSSLATSRSSTSLSRETSMVQSRHLPTRSSNFRPRISRSMSSIRLWVRSQSRMSSWPLPLRQSLSASMSVRLQALVALPIRMVSISAHTRSFTMLSKR